MLSRADDADGMHSLPAIVPMGPREPRPSPFLQRDRVSLLCAFPPRAPTGDGAVSRPPFTVVNVVRSTKPPPGEEVSGSQHDTEVVTVTSEIVEWLQAKLRAQSAATAQKQQQQLLRAQSSREVQAESTGAAAPVVSSARPSNDKANRAAMSVEKPTTLGQEGTPRQGLPTAVDSVVTMKVLSKCTGARGLPPTTAASLAPQSARCAPTEAVGCASENVPSQADIWRREEDAILQQIRSEEELLRRHNQCLEAPSALQMLVEKKKNLLDGLIAEQSEYHKCIRVMQESMRTADSTPSSVSVEPQHDSLPSTLSAGVSTAISGPEPNCPGDLAVENRKTDEAAAPPPVSASQAICHPQQEGSNDTASFVLQPPQNETATSATAPVPPELVK